MVRAVRNLGRPGLVSYAISAVDTALWDLKATLLGVPVSRLLGQARDAVPIYGSGGFTTYDEPAARAQLEQWTGEWRIPRVKIKIGESWGANEARDLARIAFARQVIGPDAELYVDANGGYTRKQAVRMARAMAGHERDLVRGTRELRRPGRPAGGPRPGGARRHRGRVRLRPGLLRPHGGRAGCRLPAGRRDQVRRHHRVLARRAVAAASGLQVSAHCAPNLHAHVCAAVPNLRHLEYFHDHVRIESMLFDGALDPHGGALRPDPARPGLGLALKAADAEKFRVA